MDVPALGARYAGWTPIGDEPQHPLVGLDGAELAGGRLRVILGRTSRFGARYFALLLETDGRTSLDPVLTGLHNQGPLPAYNWVEVAETNPRVAMPTGEAVDIGVEGVDHVFALLFDFLPLGGHLMVEYDSPQRSETAEGLAHHVPPIATPLGAALFHIGFGAHFKDWQIAEGGSEGPRKLQAYKPPTEADASRWRSEAVQALEAFLARPASASETAKAARDRAEGLLGELQS